MGPNSPVEKQKKGKHRQEVWLQILLPVLSMTIAALVFLIYLVLKDKPGMPIISTWSQIAVIWMILPALLAGILIIGVIFLIIRGLRKFYRWLPPKFRFLGIALDKVNATISGMTDKMSTPIIGVRAKVFGVKALVSILSSKNRKSSEEQ